MEKKLTIKLNNFQIGRLYRILEKEIYQSMKNVENELTIDDTLEYCNNLMEIRHKIYIAEKKYNEKH